MVAATDSLAGMMLAIAQSLASTQAVSQKRVGAMHSLVANGYAGYATPTDLMTLTCPTGKRLTVLSANALVGATAATLGEMYYILRSAADTSGTSTTPTPVRLNSADPASTAVFNLYTAAPTLGTAIGTIGIAKALSGTLTGNPANYSFSSTGGGAGAALGTTGLGIVLNAGEALAWNWNGAALPAGFLAQMGCCYVEESV